jgi:prophage antirepressor-like protein
MQNESAICKKSDRFPKWECALKSEITILEIPNRGMTVINESGLYSLILSSKLPSAKEFKHWVTSEV